MRQGFVKTENYARFTAGVKAVEERGAAEAGMMLVHGQPGLGKSHIVYRWAEDAGAIFLRANVDWTPKYFLVELAKALNLDCHQLGIKKVLITCDTDNYASEKTILANGGVLEGEIEVDGEMIKRFWITL